MKILHLLLLGLCHAAPALPAQTPVSRAPAEVSFQFERAGLSVPRFTLVVKEDGAGTYKGETAIMSRGAYGGSAPSTTPGQPIDREIQISPETANQIFKTARALNFFAINCESKAKNLADTGRKILSYTGSDGHGSCLYNYSDTKSVMQLTEMFQAIAFTMDEGRKLDFMHRFDRLGLYSEMDVLRKEVESKRAIELGNIAPSLRSIANDEALIEKVRERAVDLLNRSSSSTAH